MNQISARSLLKRYFRIRELIRQGGLPDAVSTPLVQSLNAIVEEIGKQPCRNRDDVAAKLRLSQDLVGDWNCHPMYAAAFVQQVAEEAAVVSVSEVFNDD